MCQPVFSPGVRLSILDIFVLAVSIVATVVLASFTWWWGLIVGFVVGHFYLFCNVFRISRPLELIWAGCFALLAGGSILTEYPGWIVTIVASLIVTCIVITLEMRKLSYHGLGWQYINPKLNDWWNAHH